MKRIELSPKEQRLIDYLSKKKRKKSITSLEAINNLGDTRLSATIFTLRRKGFVILDEYKTAENRYGDKVHFKEYILMK